MRLMDHMLEQMLDYILYHILDDMIISLVTKTFNIKAWKTITILVEGYIANVYFL